MSGPKIGYASVSTTGQDLAVTTLHRLARSRRDTCDIVEELIRHHLIEGELSRGQDPGRAGPGPGAP